MRFKWCAFHGKSFVPDLIPDQMPIPSLSAVVPVAKDTQNGIIAFGVGERFLQ